MCGCEYMWMHVYRPTPTPKWKQDFEQEWDNLTQTHAWQAKMSQQDVTKLQQEVHKLKEKGKARANKLEKESKAKKNKFENHGLFFMFSKCYA